MRAQPSSSLRFSEGRLVPQQQPTSLKLTKRTDYYEQQGVKFPNRGCFHCYAEFIHALLLESDAAVTTYVPQPYRVELDRKQVYIPDVYVVRDGRIQILELKPRGDFEAQKTERLQTFFAQYDMRFEVLPNEEVLEQEKLALHWLPLVQVLAQANLHGIETETEERRLYESALGEESQTVGDLLGDAPRRDRYWSELALYRLLHRHELNCDLSGAPLDYDTVVSAWN